MDALILGSAFFYLAIFATLARNAWHEAYNSYDRDADTWDGTLDGPEHT